MNKIHSKEKSLRVILYYIVYCIVNDVIGIIFQADGSVLADIFNVVEFSLFCLFYHSVVSPGRVKKATFPLMGLFFLFACIYFSFNSHKDTFASFPTGVESILIILMCISYLNVQIRKRTDLFVYSTSNFWVIITFLIYLSGSFFLYIMTETMYHNKAFQHLYDLINPVFYILKNILLSVAMLMKATPEKDVPKKDNDWEDDLLPYKLKN